jgi:hypothetical protein
VGINHCRFHLFVAEEFLEGADVVAILQEVGGEGVALMRLVITPATHFLCVVFIVRRNHNTGLIEISR